MVHLTLPLAATNLTRIGNVSGRGIAGLVQWACPAHVRYSSVLSLGIGPILLVSLPLFLSIVCNEEPLAERPSLQLARERADLHAQKQEFVKDGKLADALQPAEKIVAIDRQMLARVKRSWLGHVGMADVLRGRLIESLEFLADLYASQGDLNATVKLLGELLSLKEEVHGKEDWQAVDARVKLAHVERLSKLNVNQRQHLTEAIGWRQKAVQLAKQGMFRDALPLLQEVADARRSTLGDMDSAYTAALEDMVFLYETICDDARAEEVLTQVIAIQNRTLGRTHPQRVANLNRLAETRNRMSDYRRAGPLYREVLEIKKEMLGTAHPEYAQSLHHLASLYRDTGQYAHAEPLYRELLEIEKARSGERHPDYAESLYRLASLYADMGQYAQAEPLYREALEIRKDRQGERHLDYLRTLESLGHLHRMMGDYARARQLYQNVLNVRKEVLGDEHPHYAMALNNLALVYMRLKDYARAEQLMRQCLEIEKTAVATSSTHARTLNNLGALYYFLEDYENARRCYREALDLTRETLGDEHPQYASSLNNYGVLLLKIGDYSAAEQVHRQALDIRKEVLGEEHCGYADSLLGLGATYRCNGDYVAAERLYRRALEVALSNLDLCARAQSERQQLAMARKLRFYLDDYLSMTFSTSRPAADTYQYVLAWKGAILTRQRWLRLLRGPDSKVAATMAELQSAASSLATLAFSTPDPKNLAVWQRQLEELTVRKEQLESDLSRKSCDVRDAMARAKLTPAGLQSVLPRDTALVDFLEYSYRIPPQPGEQGYKEESRLLAFIVRPDGPIARVELGLAAGIADAVDRWRKEFAVRRGQRTEGSNPGTELRRRVWQPLEKHLDGTKVVLVSPDGALNRLPLAALPGKKPDTYLIEEISLAVVPAPQMLPGLLARREDVVSPESPPSMFLVGNVDFDASPVVESERALASSRPWRRTRAGTLEKFQSLPLTGTEILAIARWFEKAIPGVDPAVLRADKATESAVCSEAPKYEYLHLATHGFFAPPKLQSALASRAGHNEMGSEMFGSKGVGGFHPGLLSGIVLAGANRPVADKDDGVLTALEVAQLDLGRAELVVLSACQTGLGNVAGGEGVLGLQRAFQVAGAKSLVTSLWMVDSRATQELMIRFHENYWIRNMGTLESLREAQRWMLQEGYQRGAVRLDQPKSDSPPIRTPPYYWAAFILSGDWR